MMQYQSLSITIQRAANGFVVIMPVPTATIQNMQELSLKRQITIEGQAMKEPSEVEQLQGAAGTPAPIDVKSLGIGKIDVMQNVFVFSEWSKVLDFLADKVEL